VAGCTGAGAALLAQGTGLLGAILVLMGVAGLAAQLLLVQPWIDRRFSPLVHEDPLTTAATEFARRALALGRVDEVAARVATTLRKAIGATRTLLIVPGPSGGARVLGDPAAYADATDDAYVWLASHPGPALRDALPEDAEPVRQLLLRLDVDVAIGLVHRGTLLGVLLTGKSDMVWDERTIGFFHRVALQATLALANTHLLAEADGRSELSQELSLATAVSEALLPPEILQRTGSLAVYGASRPAAECGGDFWYFRPLAEGRGVLVVGDVTGHGLAPAIVAATAKGCVEAALSRASHEDLPSASRLLALLNTAVFKAGQGRYHMTCFVAALDGRRGLLRFANAGHNFPYVVSCTQGEEPRVSALVARGNPLGHSEAGTWDEVERPITPSERIVCFTDGAVEALSEQGEPYGEKKFRQSLLEYAKLGPDALVRSLFGSVARHMGARTANDDITIVTVVLAPETEKAALQGNGIALNEGGGA